MSARIHATKLSTSSSGDARQTFSAADRRVDAGGCRYTTPLELISGLLAFPARDVGAATGLCLLGAAWTATALTILGGPPGTRTTALAIFLLMLAAIVLMLSAASLPAKPTFGLMLLLGACGSR